MLTYVTLIVFGLIYGSFLTAFIDRFQNKKPFVFVRSACPNCKTTLKPLDLIPIFSFLLCRGKCRHCSTRIKPFYPLTELSCALAFVAFYFFWPHDLAGTDLFLFFSLIPALGGLLMLAVYDLRYQLLPNKIIFPLSLLGLIPVVLRLSADFSFFAVLNIFLSILIASGVFYLFFLFYPRPAGEGEEATAMGGGDVKLGIYLGLLLADWQLAILFILFSSISGALITLPIYAIKQQKQFAFGPFLILGFWLSFWFGDQILSWYWGGL